MTQLQIVSDDGNERGPVVSPQPHVQHRDVLRSTSHAVQQGPPGRHAQRDPGADFQGGVHTLLRQGN